VHEVTVRIGSLDEDGRGVGAAADGTEVHVANALPGETVTARIEHRSPHAARAWGSPVGPPPAPSPDRVPPACPAFGRCGGCTLQHLCYPGQLTEKRRRVEAALGAHAALRGIAVDDVVASPRELHYRNKAKYVVGPGGILGSYAPGTHDVVDMAGCLVSEEPIDAVAGAVRRELARSGVAPYDERARRGELRYVVVRANHDGKVLVVIVTATAGPHEALRRAAAAIRRDAAGVAGVVGNVNPATGGAILGDTDVPLAGAQSLADEVGGVRLELSARSFFQVNRGTAARLYDEVARAVAPRRGLRVVDLYTGVGAIALILAGRGADVLGVEANAGAVADAQRSARALGLAARFVAGDAATGLAQPADVVVVNPPRKGLSAEARAALLRALPAKLVYVSCGPRSLGVDLAALAVAYEVTSVRPFDLMPGTPQVETVVSLRSRGSARPGRGGR
jgi:23S rRNA (uracil1939-C5)-methyltransferase